MAQQVNGPPEANIVSQLEGISPIEILKNFKKAKKEEGVYVVDCPDCTRPFLVHCKNCPTCGFENIYSQFTEQQDFIEEELELKRISDMIFEP